MDIALLHQEIAHHISLSRQAQGQFHDSRTYQLISYHSSLFGYLRRIFGQRRTENDWLSFIRSLACGIDFLQLIISKYLGGIGQHFEMTICQLFEDVKYLIKHIETTLACCVLFLSDDEQGLLQAIVFRLIMRHSDVIAFTCLLDFAYHVDCLLSKIVPNILGAMLQMIVKGLG